MKGVSKMGVKYLNIGNERYKMYTTILFDLDGTLLDTTKGIVDAVVMTLQQLKIAIPTDKVLKTFIGPPMQLSFEKNFGFDKVNALKAANQFRSNYKTHSLFQAKLYPGTIETLTEIKAAGYRVAVATNKSHDNAISILRKFGIAEYCDCMIGSDLGGKLDKGDIIQLAMEQMHVNREESVYIGDSIFDLDGAEKAGVDFIGVTYGFGFTCDENFQGKKYVGICHSIQEIKDIFINK